MFWTALAKAIGTIVANKAGNSNNSIGMVKSVYNMTNKMQNSAKRTSTYTGAVTNDGMYGSYGG